MKKYIKPTCKIFLIRTQKCLLESSVQIKSADYDSNKGGFLGRSNGFEDEE